MALYVIFSGFEKLDKEPINFEDVFTFSTEEARFPAVETTIDESSSMVAFRFKTASDAEKFYKANQEKKQNGKPLLTFDNLHLLSYVLEVQKSSKEPRNIFTDKQTAPQYVKMLAWIIRSLPTFCNHPESAVSALNTDDPEAIEHQALLTSFKELAESIPNSHKEAQNNQENVVVQASEAPITDVSVNFVPKSNTLLVSQGNMLKLLHKDDGKYTVSSGIFANRPKSPKDEIILSISRTSLANLLSQTDLKSHVDIFARNKSTLKAFVEFLKQTQAASEKTPQIDSLTVKIQYKYAKTVVNSLLGVLISSLKWLQALLEGTSQVLEDKAPDMKALQQDPNLETEIFVPFEEPVEASVKEKSPKKAPKKEKSSKSQSKSKEQKISTITIEGQNKPIKKGYGDNLVLKNLTINQISQSLQFLLTIDEALFAMTLHEEASEKLKRYWSNHRPRLFSAFGRLGSLLNFPGNKYSLLELAEAGLYNTQDLIYELRHFLEPNRNLEEFQNVQENTDLWGLLRKSLPDNRMVRGLPCENVPLHVSLNNIPHQFHNQKPQDKIVHVSTHPNSSIVASVSSAGEVRLWNTEVALVSLGTSNFREDPTKEPTVQVPLAPTQALLPIKDPAAMEDNFLAGLDVDEFKPTDQQQVQADQSMVETLYSMGFPVNLAQKALAITKNAGIALAVEKIFALQEEEKIAKTEKASPTKEVGPSKVKQIKSEWDCGACTFQNTDQSKLCEVCGAPAPEEAYLTEEELHPRDTKKPTDTPAESDKLNPEQQEVGVKKTFMEEAKVLSSMLVPLQTSPLSPVVVGVIFEEKNPEKEDVKKYQINFKRYIYSSTQVKKFLKKESGKGYCNLLTGTWFGQDSKNIQNHLLDEYGLVFRALEPIFIGNLRYSEPKKEGKNTLFSSDLVAFEEASLTVSTTSGRLVGSTVLPTVLDGNKEVSRVLLIWENEGKYSFKQINISVKASESLIDGASGTSSLEVKEVKTVELTIDGSFLQVETIQDKLVLVTEKQVQIFNANTIEALGPAQALPFKPTIAKVLDASALVLLQENNKAHILELGEEVVHLLRRKASVHHGASGSAEVPKAQNLKDKDLEILRGILHKMPLEGVTNQKALAILSNPRSLVGHSTKFFRSISTSNTAQDLEVTFQVPSSLISLELSLSFDHVPSQSLSTKEAEKQLLTSLQSLKEKRAERAQASQEKPQEANTSTDRAVVPSKLSALTMAEADVRSKYLPLTVNWFQGAAYNDSFPVSRLVSPNNDIFCTNYSNSQFLFEHLHGKAMLIKSVTVSSKLKPIGSCGYPVGSGLIFTSNYVSHLNIPAQFHAMNHQQYLQWLQIRSQSHDELEPWEPVGSFELDGNSESATIELNCVKSAKYVLLIPTNARTKPENYSSHFLESPVEIKFFGVSGTVLEYSETDVKLGWPTAPTKGSTGPSSDFLNAKETVVEVQAETEQGEWISIQSLQDVQVQEVISRRQTKTFSKLQDSWPAPLGIPLSGFSRQEISAERLSQTKVVKLRVRVTQSEAESTNRWIISGVGVQAYAPSQIESLSELEFSPAAFRKLLLDSKEFDKFNKELVQELNREDISQSRKQRIVSLIADIISTESNLGSLFYHHFDLKRFMLSSILSQRNFSFRESQSLLRHFSSQKSFDENLLEASLQILPNLTTAAHITPAGLNGFFSLLMWCQRLNPSRVFGNILEELHNIAKKITQLRAPEYNILRTHFGIKGPVLERELFKDTNVVTKRASKKKSKDEGEKRKQMEPVKAKLLAYYSSEVDEYLVNLGQNTQIDEIRLAFEQNNKIFRFRVQIWAVVPAGNDLQTQDKIQGPDEAKQEEIDNAKKDKTDKESVNTVHKLLHSRIYSEATWVQLTTYAYDRPNNESNFSLSEELECLGFSGLNVTAQYLVVQISYSLIPFIQSSSEKNDKKPLPEVYGRPIDSASGEIPQLQRLFDSTGIVYKTTVKYPHAAKYERYDVSAKAASYKHMFGPVGTLGAQSAQDGKGNITLILSSFM